MKPLILPILLGLAAIGCGEKKPAPAGTFEPGPVPAELASGESAFNRTCLPCHGNLAMGSDVGPPLVHIIYEPNHHSDEAIRRAISLGVVAHHWSFGPMPPQPTVTPAEAEMIVRYIRWLQGKAGIS